MRARRLLPNPLRILSAVYFLFLVLVLLRTALPGQAPPLLLPYIASLLAATALWIGGRGRDEAGSFCRVGFHLGFFAFLLSFPLLNPSQLDPDIPSTVRTLAGQAVVLSVIGFELAYGAMGAFGKPSPPRLDPPLSLARRRQIVFVTLSGSVLWLFFFLARARAMGADPMQAILTMRGEVEGATRPVGPVLAYAGQMFGQAFFASATAAGIYLTASRRRMPPVTLLCWFALLACSSLGFLRGSRAFASYALTPLLSVLWIRVSASPRLRSLRWGIAVAMGGGLLLVWGTMSVLRGGDIRRYEGDLGSDISPERHAGGALSIYTELERVVDACPDDVPFQEGRSIVPVLLGWVPRPLWPSKPYPFSATFWLAKTGRPLHELRVSIAHSITGEGYGNFGLLGAFLWPAMLGLVCRLADRYLARLPARSAPRLQLAGMCAILAAMLVRGGVAEMLNMALFPIAFSWIVVWWTSSRRS